MHEWAGLRFNAEVFSVNASNERLLKNRSLAANRSLHQFYLPNRYGLPHHAAMDSQLPSHTLNRACPKLILPTYLLE
jgi:hypothetical protein